MPTLWKKGRGNLGAFAPLLGTWVAESDSPMGKVRCTRTFNQILGDKFVQLTARWEFGSEQSDKAYEEVAIYGHIDGGIHFWSFTSDGKRSEGEIADATELHPEALGFEADMPAGRARMAYWPLADGGVKWVADAMTQKGWSRMVEHNYHPQQS